MFYVGQKVVCVDDRPLIPEYLPDPALYSGDSDDMDGLTRGVVYTVRGSIDFYGAPCLALVELPRGTDSSGREIGFHVNRFRPLQEQGMSILRAILADPKKELEAA